MSRVKKNLKIMLILFLISFVSVILIAFIAFSSVYFSAKLDKNAVISPKAQIQLYDSENDAIEYNGLNRYIPYDGISTNIVSAFVALEDKRFFTHKGIDYYRTFGALYKNVKNRYIKEGGSTITQQLAKNTQLTNEKTLKRKIKEMKLARDIEKNYTKEEILEMYLNAIYFGYGIYGIDNACRTYFNKEPIEVTVNEAAMLAGIVKNPSNYSPISNPDKANKRKNLVLKLMREQNYIAENEYEEAISIDYVYNDTRQNEMCAPYFANVLSQAGLLLDKTENEIIKSNYKIYTYYNINEQKILYDAFMSKEYEEQNEIGKACGYSAILCDNFSGGVKAYYSNVDNNVFLFRRQPGSAIKPILVYAPALESKYITTQTLFLDEKFDINGYSPSNYKNFYSGWITVEDAVKHSVNTVAVRLLSETGLDYSKRIAQNMGLNFAKEDNNLALALGGMTYGVTNLELCQAYMTLANGGFYLENSFISRIEDGSGKIIYQNINQSKQVISSDSAYLMTNMLSNTVKDGTARKLNQFSYEIAAKTGTVSYLNTDKNLDAWSVSYTTENTLCVWYGANNNNEDNAITATGGGMPTLLASYIYKRLPAPKIKQFEASENIVELEIDLYALNKDKQLYLSTQYTPEKYRKTGVFSIDNCPLEYSSYFDISRIELMVQQNNEGYLISFLHAEELDLCLVRENVYTGETEYFDVYGDNFLDNSVSEGNVYLYYLEVYSENERLGYSNSKIIFT